jgi:hydroxymethylglutaryl-CoA reductase
MALTDEIAQAIEDHSSRLARWASLDATQLKALQSALPIRRADAMIENVVGRLALPLGIATNFQVGGRDYLVPMAIEEPSVVAASSHAALMVRQSGGFEAAADEPVMIGQVQVIDLPSDEVAASAERLREARSEILALANAQDRVLAELGGGARGLEVRVLAKTPSGPMIVVHLLMDVRDAMGANAVNTACEAVAPLIEGLSRGTVALRILSNLADRRLGRAWCRIPANLLARAELGGEVVARRIVAANTLARLDPYRAATHNKGIMNGVDAVLVATGNDWRAGEAAAHSYAARDGTYRALTEWSVSESGDLVGSLEMPIAAGTVGGATRAHPVAAAALKILGVESARELATVIVSVGLAQNLAALRALVSEGIQEGHMALHARQLALAAGATSEAAAAIAEQLVAEGQITTSRARQLVEQLGGR